MSRYEHGRVLAVNETTLGSELVGAHAQGVGSLTVEDPVDFDEDGGWLSINGQVVEYATYDDDTGEITLRGTLDAAAGEGDRVDLWDELRQVVTVDKIAQVELDGDDDNVDPLEATIPLHLLDDLAEGIRGLRGESVLLEQDGDEWRIVDVLGLAASGASGARWEADDVYVLTSGDVTAGTATCPLSRRPVVESVAAVAGGVPQEPTEFTVNYDAQSVTWPLAGFEAAGDRMWFHYQYLAGAASAGATEAATPPANPWGEPVSISTRMVRTPSAGYMNAYITPTFRWVDALADPNAGFHLYIYWESNVGVSDQVSVVTVTPANNGTELDVTPGGFQAGGTLPWPKVHGVQVWPAPGFDAVYEGGDLQTSEVGKGLKLDARANFADAWTAPQNGGAAPWRFTTHPEHGRYWLGEALASGSADPTHDTPWGALEINPEWGNAT